MFNQNEFTGNSSGDVEIDDITYPGERLVFRVTQEEICPYVGIGGTFVHFGKAKRWALGGEIGVAFRPIMIDSVAARANEITHF